MGLYINRQKIMDPIYHKISYNCYLSNAFMLKLEQNPKIHFIEMERATWKVITEHIIIPGKVITASCVKVRCAQLLTIIHILWMVQKRVEEREKRREWRMVAKRMILVLM